MQLFEQTKCHIGISLRKVYLCYEKSYAASKVFWNLWTVSPQPEFAGEQNFIYAEKRLVLENEISVPVLIRCCSKLIIPKWYLNENQISKHSLVSKLNFKDLEDSTFCVSQPWAAGRLRSVISWPMKEFDYIAEFLCWFLHEMISKFWFKAFLSSSSKILTNNDRIEKTQTKHIKLWKLLFFVSPLL